MYWSVSMHFCMSLCGDGSVCHVQGFVSENMKPWRAHWDRQLYKALEFQYQMGLEALNENLPEIRVELTYRSDWP